MRCSHPAAAITDRAVHALEGDTVRYAWRGACTSCRHGVVGVTSVPAGLAPEHVSLLLANELKSYLSQVAAQHA
ncbi:MAG TPA: hypothetical protein VKV26_03350 [Dehalococcoidia bacterium]|nr:hypothetical protein [Dehalococcoidia bacterium]